jgi:hypothetical protein
MLKKIFYGIYTLSLKKSVDFLLSKTTVDEKIVKISKETGRRLKNMKEEIKDVGEAAKETFNQLDDIVDAAKGEKRKGRKPKKNKKS